MEHYTIWWKGPFTYDEVIEDEGYGDDEDLYAIAHIPPKRAPRTLYIGRSFRQYVADRLKRHHADYAIYEKYGEKSIRYYLGRIRLKRGQRRSEKRVADIEAAIIYNHGDELEFNVQSTAAYYGRALSISHKGSVPPGLEDFKTSDWD